MWVLTQSALALGSLPTGSLTVRGQGAEIVGIHWYDGSEGYLDPKAPSLALAFSTGKVQLTRGTLDTEPIIIDTGMEVRRVCWNTNGTVLGVAGMQRVGAEQVCSGAACAARRTAAQGVLTQVGSQRSNAAVQFYNPYGYFLRKLKVPGEQLSDISWEGGGLRLAVRAAASALRGDPCS